MSPSRKARLTVIVLMAILGATFFFGFLSEDMGHVTEEQRDTVSQTLVLRYIVAMALGGAIGGAITAGLFGRHGVLGWLLGFVGGVLASLLGGFFGSALGLVPDLISSGFVLPDVVAVGFGFVLIPLSLVGEPLMVAVWLALVVITHVLARRARNG
ncbi:MAG: hypothetical protein AAGF79_14225 [Pseudomonadota bacterium]